MIEQRESLKKPGWFSRRHRTNEALSDYRTRREETGTGRCDPPKLTKWNQEKKRWESK